MQDKKFIKVLDTDFVISNPNLMRTFVGDIYKLREWASQFIQSLQSTQSELIATRINTGGVPVTVCTNKELFINSILEKGVLLKTEKPGLVQKDDLIISKSSLTRLFIGDPVRLIKIAQEIITLLEENLPDIISKRSFGTGGSIVTVCTNRQRLIEEMQKRGIRLKNEKLRDYDPESDSSTVKITNMNLTKLFEYTDFPKVQIVEERILPNYPHMFEVVRSGRQEILLCKNRDFLINQMWLLGVELRDSSLEPLKPDDFAIIEKHLYDTFVGHPTKLGKLAKMVKQRIENENPDLIIRRRSGIHTIWVCTDKDLFFKYMIDAGVKPR